MFIIFHKVKHVNPPPALQICLEFTGIFFLQILNQYRGNLQWGMDPKLAAYKRGEVICRILPNGVAVSGTEIEFRISTSLIQFPMKSGSGQQNYRNLNSMKATAEKKFSEKTSAQSSP